MVCHKDKADDYNGKEVIMNQIKNGTEKRLIGLKMLDRAMQDTNMKYILKVKKSEL